MKKIKYQMLQTTVIDGVELPKSEEYLASVTIPYSVENEEIAKTEAYNGEYTIEDDGKTSCPVAPHNILEGEYVTIGGTLYLATQNIPSGEPVIAGQNAVETTVEEQLLMMKGE